MINPLIEALKQKLKVSVRYFTQVLHIGIESDSFKVPLIICLSEHSILFLDSNLFSLVGEVFYAQIQKVSEASNCSEEVLKLEFSNNRPQGMPKKMTIISTDKGKLLKHLKLYWETDYIWRQSKVSKLQISREPIEITRYLKKAKKNLNMYLLPPPGSIKYEKKNYVFFVDDLFTYESEQLNANYEKTDYMLKIDIEDLQFIEHNSVQIKYLAEEITEKHVTDQKYSVVINQPYIKKFNLIGDLAIWEGWETGLIFETFQLFTIVFMRKFIPPVMDSYQVLIITCKGGKYCRFFCENTADSVYSLTESDEVYTNIMQQKCDALIMNEEIMRVYQDNFNITPDKAHYAYQILVSLLKLLNKYFPSPKLSKRIEILKKKYSNPIQTSSYSKKVDLNSLLEAFIRSSYLVISSTGFKIWRKKVLRYLSYCLNGGLTDNKITFSEIFPYVMKLDPDLKETQGVRVLFTRLLNVRSSINDEEFEDLVEAVKKILGTGGFSANQTKYSPKTLWYFNQSVMKAFIENDYLKKELESAAEPGLYPRMLIYLLQFKKCEIELKIVVCRACSTLQDSVFFNTKTVIPHLIDLFLHKNNTVAALAGETLLTLLQVSRDNKKVVLSSLETIKTRLNSKDPIIVNNTLTLMHSLATDQSTRKYIFDQINDSLLPLTTFPKSIPTNIQTLSKLLQLLTILSKDPSISNTLSSNDHLLSFILDQITRNEDLTQTILEFLQSLCTKNQISKSIIGQKGIPRLLAYLKSSQNLETIKQSISLFRLLSTNKNDDNHKILVSRQAIKVLETLLQSPKINTDSTLTQQIKDFKDFLL